MQKQITKEYQHKINTTRSGLVAISISARCKSKKQLKSNTDEDLRIEIDSVYFRENPPQKNIQKFNIPVAFNGTELKGLRKTVVILAVLNEGEHTLSLIPKSSAYIESLEKIYQELKISCEDSKLIDCNSLRVESLKIPLLNVRYVAAKIKFSQERWEKAGININNRPEIVGTLYNIEDVDKPIEPHVNPRANSFGKGVEKNFNKIKEIFNP